MNIALESLAEREAYRITTQFILLLAMHKRIKKINSSSSFQEEQGKR